MNSIQISTMKELEAYRSEGYRSDVSDLCQLLSISLRKARTLLKNAPRVELSEDLYYRLKYRAEQSNSGYTPARIYYNDLEIIGYLIRNYMLQVFYGDAHKVYSKLESEVTEKQFQASYLTSHIKDISGLFEISRTTAEIVNDEAGYHYFATGVYDGKEKDIYIHEDDYYNDGEITFKFKEEIYNRYTNYDLKKCERDIKKDFYIKFKIGGTIKYFFLNSPVNDDFLKTFIPKFIRVYEDEWLSGCK